MGSGCGAVGRAVASISRGPRFESRHRQKFIVHFTVNCVERTKIKEKEAGNGPFFKNSFVGRVSRVCFTFRKCPNIYDQVFTFLCCAGGSKDQKLPKNQNLDDLNYGFTGVASPLRSLTY